MSFPLLLLLSRAPDQYKIKEITSSAISAQTFSKCCKFRSACLLWKSIDVANKPSTFQEMNKVIIWIWLCLS